MNCETDLQNWYTGLYVLEYISVKKDYKWQIYLEKSKKKHWFVFLSFSLPFKITPTNTIHNYITTRFYSISAVGCKNPQSFITILSIRLFPTPTFWYLFLSMSLNKSCLVAEGRKDEMHVWYWKKTHLNFLLSRDFF